MQKDGKPTPTSSTASDWREIASQASKEPDPEKLSELVQQLCDRLDEIEEQKKSPSQNASPGPDGHSPQGE